MNRTRRNWLSQTRRLTIAVAAIGLIGASSGCGFKLRRGYDMAFKTIQLTGFVGTSPMAAELARALEASGVSVVDSTLAATQAASASSVPSSHIVFEALLDKRDMVVSTTTAYGQIRDMTARNTLRFQIKRGDGSILVPAADLALAREMTYNEKDALAKQDELAALHTAMQSDIVNQLLRRLAAIRPDQLITPVEAPVPSVVHAPSAPDAAASR
ncbi:LPS-assembly lipoprotein LptE [Aquabacterium sp.]|uniref:LPS-assembly lipoprotein LptE n=1 Tax=Aquabacterium sp. TaxID=1872578 RepID=UPI0040377917